MENGLNFVPIQKKINELQQRQDLMKFIDECVPNFTLEMVYYPS